MNNQHLEQVDEYERFNVGSDKPLSLIRNEMEVALAVPWDSTEPGDRGLYGTGMLKDILARVEHPLALVHFACIADQGGSIGAELSEIILSDIRLRPFPPTFPLDGVKHEKTFNTAIIEDAGYNTTLVSIETFTTTFAPLSSNIVSFRPLTRTPSQSASIYTQRAPTQ